MKNSLQSRAERKGKQSGHDYFKTIEEVQEEVYDETEKDSTRFSFLLEAKAHLPCIHSNSEPSNKML